jgi:Holliday junction DNA helicase RuvA
VVITTGGIGYRITVPLRTLEELPEEGEITLYSHLTAKDDSLKLYGFQSPLERDLFLMIMSVSKIGAATALSFLSEIPPRKLMEAVSGENIALLQSVKGVGAQTARRLVLELRDKVKEWYGITAGMESLHTKADGPVSKKGEDLLRALLALGYPRFAAKEAAHKALKSCAPTEELETLIKTALRNL